MHNQQKPRNQQQQHRPALGNRQHVPSRNSGHLLSGQQRQHLVQRLVQSAKVIKLGPQDFYYDAIWLTALLLVILCGFVMLASASLAIASDHYHNPFYFIIRHTIFCMLALVASWLTIQLPLARWSQYSGQLIILSFILLLLVLTPGIGLTVNGSSRWLNLHLISLQVSELVKIAVVLYLAGYLVRQRSKLASLGGFLRPLCILGVLAVLLLLEPDFGSTVVISATMLGMLFLAGARIGRFLLIFVLIALLFAMIMVISPYRVLRLTSFLDPWKQAFGSGYQLTQSLIAFGQGGWLGKGLGHSVQKLFYLPEAHTDFLFAILAEETGVLGTLLLIGSYIMIAYRSLRIACLAAAMNAWYICLVVAGLVLNLSMQVIINMGVNIGLLPTKGLALPFISYGGSNLLFNSIGMAIIARSYHELCVKQQRRITKPLSQ